MRHHLRTWLIAGLLVVLPLAVTVLVLLAMFRFLDSLLGPFVTAALGTAIPGLGLIAGIVLILVTGALASNFVGRRVVDVFHRLMLRIPLARVIYAATKQLADAVFVQSRGGFKGAVLVEWPRQGVYTIGFVTGETRGEAERQTSERLVNVFVMTTPNPTTGFLCLVPESQLIPMNMSMEDALKMMVSGGLVSPRVPAEQAQRLVRRE
jgi:uncharacterized membrane protein